MVTSCVDLWWGLPIWCLGGLGDCFGYDLWFTYWCLVCNLLWLVWCAFALWLLIWLIFVLCFIAGCCCGFTCCNCYLFVVLVGCLFEFGYLFCVGAGLLIRRVGASVGFCDFDCLVFCLWYISLRCFFVVCYLSDLVGFCFCALADL